MVLIEILNYCITGSLVLIFGSPRSSSKFVGGTRVGVTAVGLAEKDVGLAEKDVGLTENLFALSGKTSGKSDCALLSAIKGSALGVDDT